MENFAFDPNAVEDDGYDGSPIPNGDYIVVATEVEKRDTKANNGSWYLNFTFEVADGPMKGRKFWNNLNMVNQNPDAQRIAHQEYKRLHIAIGSGPTKNPTELLNRPFKCAVGLQKNDTSRNELKKLYPRDGVVTQPAPTPDQTSQPVQQPVQQVQQPAAEAQVQPAQQKMPWEN